jgi:4-hydroxybenzoate polyprenyltransferase
VLELIQEARAAGRRVLLVTAADRHVADLVAEHLGLFDEVVGSDGVANMKAERKRDLLVERFGEGGFDYAGDSPADVPVLAAAERGYLVGPGRATRRRARTRSGVPQLLAPRASRLGALFRQLRIHQWAKNALVLLPVALADGGPTLDMIGGALVAFVSFSLCASSGYVLNDLLDVEADRAHRSKFKRPFASGDLPIVWGPPYFVALFAASVAIGALLLPVGFLGMLALYFVTTIAYSFYLKSKLMLDVLVLAGLYTHRILTGGVATGVPISTWLLAFSMFLFISLAFAKRFVELLDAPGSEEETVRSRGYTRSDLDMVVSMGPASGYIAVLVFSLYLSTDRVQENYTHPALLWLISPLLLYWISRIWFRARRRRLHDDPVKFALKDPLSLAFGVLVVGIAALAKLLPAGDYLNFVH